MKQNVPEIRFKGCQGEWERKELSDCLEISDEKNLDGQFGRNDVLSVSDDFGVVNQIELLGRSYAGKSLANYDVLRTGQIVYTKSPLRSKPYGIIKLNTGRAGIVSSLYAVYNAKPNVSADYLHWYFDPAWRLNSYIRPLVNKGAKNTMNISDETSLTGYIAVPPTLSEQRQIASYFRSLDGLLSGCEARLSSLRRIKEGALQDLFPQPGETQPKIRFKGCHGEWERKKLGEIFDERVEFNADAEMLSVTINQGIIRASDNGKHDGSSEDKSHYKVVKVNDIAYNSMRMWQGASGCSPFEGIVSPAYTVVTPKEGIDANFFAYYFKTASMIKLFRLNSQGLTSDTWNLKYPAFGSIDTACPPTLPEQRQIASYFRTLDHLIDLDRRRLEKLRQLKAACLEKMFV